MAVQIALIHRVVISSCSTLFSSKSMIIFLQMCMLSLSISSLPYKTIKALSNKIKLSTMMTLYLHNNHNDDDEHN